MPRPQTNALSTNSIKDEQNKREHTANGVANLCVELPSPPAKRKRASAVINDEVPPENGSLSLGCLNEPDQDVAHSTVSAAPLTGATAPHVDTASSELPSTLDWPSSVAQNETHALGHSCLRGRPIQQQRVSDETQFGRDIAAISANDATMQDEHFAVSEPAYSCNDCDSSNALFKTTANVPATPVLQLEEHNNALAERNEHLNGEADKPTESSAVLVRFGDAAILENLLSRQYPAVKVALTVQDMKMELTGTTETVSRVTSWLGEKSNKLTRRSYSISHPLLTFLITQPSHNRVMAEIGRMCDCVIAPAADCVDLRTAARVPGDGAEVTLKNDRAVKIALVRGDISRQNVDVILKPVFSAQEFAVLGSSFAQTSDDFRRTWARSGLRSRFAPLNGVRSPEYEVVAFSAEPGVLLCKNVLHVLFKDTASSAVSSLDAAAEFFAKCMRELQILGAETFAVPVEALCDTNVFNGDVNYLQFAIEQAVKRYSSASTLKCLRQIRLVMSSCPEEPIETETQPIIPRVLTNTSASSGSSANSGATAATAQVLTNTASASSSTASVRASASPGRKAGRASTVLKLGSSVALRLVKGNIAEQDAEALVSNTKEGSRSLADGGASCKAIFAAGGDQFARRARESYPDGLPKDADCGLTKAKLAYSSLKCDHVIHVCLPPCPEDAVTAEKTVKAKAAACLSLAARYDADSIAFPLIGAGGLGYSADVVAKGLIAAAAEWAFVGRAHYLQDVRIVIHSSDQVAYAACLDLFRRFSRSGTVFMPWSTRPISRAPQTITSFRLGSIDVQLDQTPLHACRDHVLLASQHEVQFASEWLDALASALAGADSFRVTSVVIPLRKDALEALTPEYIADLFYAACLKFATSPPKHLRSLRPRLESAEAAAAFWRRLTDLATMAEQGEAETLRRGRLSSPADAVRRFWSSKSTETLVRQLNELEEKLVRFGLANSAFPCFNLDLSAYCNAQAPYDYVIYGKPDAIAQAVGILNDIQAPLLTKGSFQDNTIDYVSKGYTQRLTSAYTDFSIISKPGSTNAVEFMALVGDALAQLADLDSLRRLPKGVTWYLQTPDAVWHPFVRSNAFTLEYLANHAPSMRQTRFALFDFDQQTVSVGSSVMRIARQMNEIPMHWTARDDDIAHRMIALSPQSGEYKDIHAILQRTNTTRRQVTQIQRIENRPLFRQYLIQKEKITRSCPNGHVVERDLFHGTAQEHLDGICADGFDRSRAGQSVGAIYGAGSYFSTTFDYSSHRNYAREGHVFYCKVLVGQSIQGTRGLAVLPYKPGFSGIKYDSAVNDLLNPSIFVIFADHNAYPAYLITLAV